MKPLRILLSGGGTGGHIFPAIAIANEIRSRYPDAIIEFVGASDRMEMEKVPAAGYKIHGIRIAGFQRSLSLKNLSFPFKLVAGLLTCYTILKQFKPDAVIGTGGFASGPLLKVANWLGIRTIIQEQNSYAGVTNKLLGKKAGAICLGFEEAMVFFPKEKCVVTGNPVRQSLLHLPSQAEARIALGLDPQKKTLLVIGGSLGARTINQSVDQLTSHFESIGLQVIWQTGKLYEPVNPPVFGYATKFIDRMELVYAACDLIVSRAGAISISELCLVGKPVILVPSPNVAEDHQTKNAMALVNKNAAILVKDAEAREQLGPAIDRLLANPEDMEAMGSAIKQQGKPDAAARITDTIINLLNTTPTP